MKLYVIPAGPIQTNAYLLTDSDRGEAILIDAPGGIWAKIAPQLQADGVALKALWITHGHWDHTQGGAEVVREANPHVVAHADDKALIETPEIMEGFMGEKLGLEPIPVDQWVEQGDMLEALGVNFEVRHVPGHCPGNIMFVLAAAGAAFVGDAVFAGSVGRTDLPGGSLDVLTKSIREQIYTLPDEMVLYPGHGQATTVGNEKQSNPYVRPE
ncbi:MBL fold metallo-hydrolase [Actomonas aquatica]|uniref:MBL fold metallo-hydrolase n=1 Tax=Actomonas aquatica TaxID=2866162 RepID=A0ABZ1CCZ2_9BACT|nr:MBL fold metallo-hydrolase [Opitutus sp. WL0086]WRQ88170.1 MBL fold metallo-hydrolase [Opitutus sp. WL0086]